MTGHDILKSYEELLTRYLAGRTNMVMFILDGKGCLVWVNAAFREMIGRQGQLEGLHIRELLAHESRELLAAGGAGITDGMQLLFSKDAHPSHMLTCSVLEHNDHILVLCEQIMATETVVMQRMTVLNNEMGNLTRELHRKNMALQQTMAELNVLRGLLPICMHCKKIRDEKGYWNQLEAYISNHSDTRFSHGICDDCLNTLYPEAAEQMRKDRNEQ